MGAYESNLDDCQVVSLLTGARCVIITTHAKPDGDAFGAVVALARVLRRGNADVSAFLEGPVHTSFRNLPGYELVRPYDRQREWPAADLVVLVDTGAWAQLEPMRSRLEPRLEQMLIIDHHVSGDVPAAWRYIDSKAAATCEILGHLFGHMALTEADDGALDLLVAEALFVGLASDTGWFRFSNTRAQTLELSARLLRAGVDHAGLYRKLEQTERVEKLTLMIRALDSLRLVADDRAALMVLRAEDFAQTGAMLEETERFVDLPQVVETVQVVALVTEPPPVAGDSACGSSSNGRGPGEGAIRLSFRSKPGPNAVDVAQLAAQFGGGRHQRAAGAKVIGPLNEVSHRVAQAIAAAVAR